MKNKFLGNLFKILIIFFITIGTIVSILTVSYEPPGTGKIPEESLTLIEAEKSINHYASILGRAPLKNSHYRHSKTNEFSVDYYFGKFLQRLNDHSKGREKHLFLLGGSNTFGHGVDHNKDLGSNLQEKLKDTHVLNLSYLGHGLGQALARCEKTAFHEITSIQEGQLIYNHYYFHIQRFLGDYSTLKWSWGEIPRYELKNGKFLNQGLYSDSSLYKLFTYLLNHPWLDNYAKKRIDLISESSYKKYALGMGQLKKCYLDKYPKGRFIVSLSPFVDDSKFNNQLKPFLKEFDIEFWEWETKPDTSFKQKDGHLNEAGYREYSSLIINKL